MSLMVSHDVFRYCNVEDIPSVNKAGRLENAYANINSNTGVAVLDNCSMGCKWPNVIFGSDSTKAGW